MHNVIMRGAKDQPRTHAGATDSGWSSMCSSHAGIGGAKRGRVPSAAQDGGIGDRDMVVNNHARARPRCCTALATIFDTIAPSIAELTAATARRSLERQHRTHTAFP